MSEKQPRLVILSPRKVIKLQGSDNPRHFIYVFGMSPVENVRLLINEFVTLTEFSKTETQVAVICWPL